MLPAWADVLIVCALPLILTLVLLLIGDEEPDNGTVHYQENGEQDGGSDPDEKPPDAGAADDVALTADLAA